MGQLGIKNGLNPLKDFNEIKKL